MVNKNLIRKTSNDEIQVLTSEQGVQFLGTSRGIAHHNPFGTICGDDHVHIIRCGNLTIRSSEKSAPFKNIWVMLAWGNHMNWFKKGHKTANGWSRLKRLYDTLQAIHCTIAQHLIHSTHVRGMGLQKNRAHTASFNFYTKLGTKPWNAMDLHILQQFIRCRCKVPRHLKYYRITITLTSQNYVTAFEVLPLLFLLSF